MAAEIRLDTIAKRFGVPQRTVIEWHHGGVLRADNRGVGRGRGLWVTPDQAREAVALFMLRDRGVPYAKLKDAVRRLRLADRAGKEFLCLGSTEGGGMVLVDGDGDHVPLRDPATGQYFLALTTFDLRAMRAHVEDIISEVPA